MNEFIKRNSLLEKKRIYQAAFFIVIFSTLILRLIFNINPELFLEGTFIVVCILLGIGFRHISYWYIFLVTLLLSYLSGYIGGMGILGMDIIYYAFHWMAYFLLTSMIKLLIQNYEKEQEDTLSLVVALSKTLDARDGYTASHSENVAKYAVMIAERLKLPERMCQNIFIGALLHDIGKIGIPEHIVNKPARLTDSEYEAIMQHPKMGYEMVNHISKFEKNCALDIILYHHERYDGKGYPFELKEHAIPLAARIVSVADSFDAMTSKRVYRTEPLTLDYVINELKTNSGVQFDPDAANAMIELIKEDKIKVDTGALWIAGAAR